MSEVLSVRHKAFESLIFLAGGPDRKRIPGHADGVSELTDNGRVSS